MPGSGKFRDACGFCRARLPVPKLSYRTRLLITTALSAPFIALASPALAVNVANETELRNAIFAANAGGDTSINITSNITLTQSLPMISSSVTVNGNNNTINANNAGRAFFVQSGTVSISNVTVNNAFAKGGDGGNSGGNYGGGGGGMGAGAAVFVNTGANVTVSNVTVGNAAAQGGAGGTLVSSGFGTAGGGGGLGGDGGNPTTTNAGGGGGGYEGAGSLGGDTGGGAGGGEFGNGGTGAMTGGGGGGGQQANGGNASGATGGAGGGTQGGAGGNAGNPGTNGAAGGGGGGGGNAANGGAGGIGGGGGSGGFGGNGGAGGDFGGGGAGTSSTNVGGAGGFGGGGGGTQVSSTGGAGGFGGGGGNNASGGTFGGSSSGTAGGGGAALGGAVFVRDGGTLTITDTAFGGVYSVAGGTGAGAGQAQGTVMFLHGTGATTLNVSGSQTIAGTGAIAGDGELSKTGTGDLTISGANANYSGTTTITQGTIAIGAANSLGTGTIAFGDGAIQSNAAVTVANAINITTNAAFNPNGNDTTLSGTISGGGRLTKSGSGTLTISGNNNYAGGTRLDNGSLAIGSNTALGTGTVTTQNGVGILTTGTIALANNFTLDGGTSWSNSGQTTLSGTVSGAGGLSKTGAGTLTLNSANTYQGGTTVQSGTIALGNNASLGTGTLTFNGATVTAQSNATLTMANAIALTSNGTWNTNGFNTSLSGNLTGAGALTKTGTGNLTLTGSNNYSGGTTVSAGTLTGNTSSLQGNITNNAAVEFNQTTTDVYAGNMSGSGSLTKSGAGQLVLTGTNNYTGGTTISAGNLQGNTNSLQGDIVNNGGLVVFAQSSDGIYAGDLSGTGGLDKSLAGNLNLTGNTTYLGATTVYNGTLRINGTGFASAVTVNTGGTLGGTGTIGNDVTIAGGTWAPGNSIGTQNVTGNVTFNAGSVYSVEVDSSGASDRIAATGTAALGNAAVSVQAAAGTYGFATQYTILTAAGGITGTFGSVTSDLAFLTPTLTYDLTSVFLTMTRNDVNFAQVAATGNQKAVAGALDQAAANNQMTSVITALTGLNASQAQDAYNQMSGEAYADTGSVNLFAGQQFMGMLGQQMNTARGASGSGFNDGTRVNLASLAAPKFGDAETGANAGSPMRAGPWNAWMSGVGVTGKVDGNSNSATFNYSGGGGAVGVDKQVTPDLIAGVAAGYANTSLYTQGVSSNGTVDSYQGAFYGSYNPSAFYVQGLVGYAYNDNSMERTISFPGISSTANGDTSSNQFLGAVEGGYEFPVDRLTSLTPFLGIQSTFANQASFTETGAGALNLNVDGQTTTSVRSILGFQVDHDLNLGFANPIGLLARAGWAHEYADTTRPMTASFAGAPGAGFTVDGAQIARDSAVLALGATAKLTQNLSFLIRYDADLNGADNANAVSGKLSYSW